MSGVTYIPMAAMAVLFCTVLLKECGWRGYGLVSTVGLVGLFVAASLKIGEIFGEMGRLAEEFGIGQTATVTVKAVGVSYCFGISSDICRNMGEGGIASMVDTAGRVELALLALPLVKVAVEMGVGFLNG